MATLDVDSIFRPTREIDPETADLFAGRRQILSDAVAHLAKSDHSIAFYGERGIGKSSLGRMLVGILEGSIPQNSLQLATNAQSPGRKCVWINWTSSIRSIEHLLYEMLDPKLKEKTSFARQFPEMASRIAERYRRINAGELTQEKRDSNGRPGPNQELVLELIRLTSEAPSARGKQGSDSDSDLPVIVLDDIDQAQQALGLGALIRDCPVQIVLIGSGESIEDLLDDPLAPAKPLAGGQFLVPPLDHSEVRELFAKAAEKATGQGVKIRFTDKFCDLVASDFGGYPAQIQAFGMDVLTHFRRRLERWAEVVVSETDYVYLLKLRETSPNRDIRVMSHLDAGISASTVRWETLKTIVRLREQLQRSGITLDELQSQIRDQDTSALHNQVQAMVTMGVLKTDDPKINTINIASPAMLCEINCRIRRNWDPQGWESGNQLAEV